MREVDFTKKLYYCMYVLTNIWQALTADQIY